MKLSDQILVRRLGLVLGIKLVLLFCLWWGFVRDQRVEVDASGMAAQALVQSSVSIEKDKQ
ncbi:MAG: hypothetical protein CO105_05565 [Comamonadaceae bacterium CG_4_9_14_3_um_filter_60_33]|nr:MAG: hypothetical protein AUK51_09065 [Comamonadaceae bacterium CG2_30_59_20]PIY29016.1 MAG: hypothetical protein COZ09_06965 [Comamonadaceae bacterium CG_4_10_14_3_um_filter_60_42]PJB44714.1 MAG: hypothetical protein CO105_05565 [Comamonadaceae bacterium CG_4_9_14_3_um_filter_60_33]